MEKAKLKLVAALESLAEILVKHAESAKEAKTREDLYTELDIVISLLQRVAEELEKFRREELEKHT